MLRYLGIALLAALPGCLVNFDETTVVRVRSPHAVGVGVRTPTGGEWLIPAYEDDGKAHEVPDSTPPLTEGDKFATVKRNPYGDVTLSCPSCQPVTEASIVPRAEPITVTGPLETTVRDEGDHLSFRYSFPSLFPCYRGGHLCPREAIALWLTTPRENVIEIRHTKVYANGHHERVGAWVATILGGVVFAGGVAIDGAALEPKQQNRGPVLGIGGTFNAVGGFFLVAGLLGVLAKDSEEIVYPSSKTVRPP